MPLGLFDNKGKIKKGVPLLMAILGITCALSVWGVSEVYANNNKIHEDLKTNVSNLTKADTEILQQFNGKVEDIYKEMQRTGINPAVVATMLDNMKKGQQEVFNAQLESQSILLDNKIEKATGPIVATQQQIQQNMAEVLSKFEQQQQVQQQQQQQVTSSVVQLREYTQKQEQINIRNAHQMGELNEQLKANKTKADEILKALIQIQKALDESGNQQGQ